MSTKGLEPSRTESAVPEAVRLVRIIARLNIGGPAIQAIRLTKRLEEYGFQTTLVRGREDPDEGSMDYLAGQLAVQPVLVPWLRRNPGWWDLPALVSLIRILRRERPMIVHTHAAKGGTLGRVATLAAFPRKRTRPTLIHTFHGHSLTGYFSPRVAAVYRAIERVLAGQTDRLIAVSEQVRDELVALSVAPSSKFEIVPLGFDLEAFSANGSVREEARERLRAKFGIPSDARVVTLIARLVPIKRVDRFLRVANALRDRSDVHFVIVGDGELRDRLMAGEEAKPLEGRLTWTGFLREIPEICFASDVVALTSDNEGTPVSLIEALAAGIPVVSTDVGGVRGVVHDGQTGLLVSPRDEQGMAHAVARVLDDPDLATQLAANGQRHALRAFSETRLLSDLLDLYERSSVDDRHR